MRTYTEDGKLWMDIEVSGDGSAEIEIQELESSMGMEYGLHIPIKDIKKFSNDLIKLIELADEK